MKVILATPLYPPETGDLSVYVRDLLKLLASEVDLTVVAYAGRTVQADDIKVIAINKQQPLFKRIMAFSIKLLQLSGQVDFIFAQNAMAAGLPAVIVHYWSRVPVIVNFFEDEAWKRAINLQLSKKSYCQFLAKPEGNGSIKRIIRIQKWVLGHASRVIVPSQAVADLVQEFYGVSANKLVVIARPLADPEKLPFKSEFKKRQIFVLARLFEWSGLSNLLEASTNLSSQYPDLKIIVSGDGPARRAMVVRARSLGLGKKVEFIGQVSRTQNTYLKQTSGITINSAAKHDFTAPDSKFNLNSSPDDLAANLFNHSADKELSWTEHVVAIRRVFKSLQK